MQNTLSLAPPEKLAGHVEPSEEAERESMCKNHRMSSMKKMRLLAVAAVLLAMGSICTPAMLKNRLWGTEKRDTVAAVTEVCIYKCCASR